jgi:hypothetical protein
MSDTWEAIGRALVADARDVRFPHERFRFEIEGVVRRLFDAEVTVSWRVHRGDDGLEIGLSANGRAWALRDPHPTTGSVEVILRHLFDALCVEAATKIQRDRARQESMGG